MEYRALHINPKSAENLCSNMDVYAEVSIADYPQSKKRTAVTKNCGTNPKWKGEQMEFMVGEPYLTKPGLSLLVQLKAESSDKEVCSVVVPIHDLFGPDPAREKTVKYQLHMPSGKPEGFLKFSHRFGEKFSLKNAPDPVASKNQYVSDPTYRVVAQPYPEAYPEMVYPQPQTSGNGYQGPPPPGYGYAGQPPPPGYGYAPPLAGQPQGLPPSGYGYAPPPAGYGQLQYPPPPHYSYVHPPAGHPQGYGYAPTPTGYNYYQPQGPPQPVYVYASPPAGQHQGPPPPGYGYALPPAGYGYSQPQGPLPPGYAPSPAGQPQGGPPPQGNGYAPPPTGYGYGQTQGPPPAGYKYGQLQKPQNNNIGLGGRLALSLGAKFLGGLLLGEVAEDIGEDMGEEIGEEIE